MYLEIYLHFKARRQDGEFLELKFEVLDISLKSKDISLKRHFPEFSNIERARILP